MSGALDDATFRDFSLAVRSAFVTTEVDCAPSLRGYAPHAGSGLARLAGTFGRAAPYWAYLWPGGAALIQHLHAFPQCVAGKRVLDLGAGSGLVGIAAAALGARSVVACDVDPLALAMCRLNAELNGVALAVSAVAARDAEVVLGGDVFYDAKVARASLRVLTGLEDGGREILLGDPGRAHLPLRHLTEIGRYPARDVGDGRDRTALAAVYRFRGVRERGPGLSRRR